MRQYVKVLAVIFLVGFLFSGFLGCGRKKDMEAPMAIIQITELGGNRFTFDFQRSAFSNPVGQPYLVGQCTNGEYNLLLIEVEDDDGIVWLTVDDVWMAGHRKFRIVYKNGNNIILPVVSDDEPGYNAENHCWEINFFQSSYEFISHGEYADPTPIRLAGASKNEIAVEINVFPFDPTLSFPIYVSGEWDWDVKVPYYPNEEGFIRIILTAETVKDDFNLSWFDPNGKEIWMNLNELKRQGVPCIKGGTGDNPGAWNIGDDWEDLLPITLLDPNSYIVPHVCVDDPNNCCCIDDVETDVTDDACVCPNCPSCPTCPECSDANQPIIDPETGLQFYGDEVWGDPEPNSHFRFRREDDEEWTLFFLKSDVPVDEQIGDMALRGTFNNWKSTVPLVDSEIFDGWIQTENPIDIDPGKQRLNFIFGEFYANHSNFISSLFHLEHEGDYSFGIVVPEEDDKLRPWD